jgi:hypothetical protein
VLNCFVVSFCVELPLLRVVLSCIVLCNVSVALCLVLLCYLMPCRDVSCRVVSCRVVLNYCVVPGCGEFLSWDVVLICIVLRTMSFVPRRVLLC